MDLYDESRGAGVKHWTDWAKPSNRDPIADWALKLKKDRLKREEAEKKANAKYEEQGRKEREERERRKKERERQYGKERDERVKRREEWEKSQEKAATKPSLDTNPGADADPPPKQRRVRRALVARSLVPHCLSEHLMEDIHG